MKSKEDLGEELCNYCPLEEYEKGTQGIPSGYTSCEGCRCEEAYQIYLEEIESDNPELLQEVE